MALPKQLDAVQKSQLFYKTLHLNFDCGAETLRALIDKKISEQNISLQQHLSKHADKLNLFEEERKKFQDIIIGSTPSSCCDMDVRLLTVLLRHTFCLNPVEIQNIKALKNCRNKLAHLARLALEDDVQYNTANNAIQALCQSIDKVSQERIKQSIKELEKHELVWRNSNTALVRLYNEDLMAQLIEADKGSSTDDKINLLWIKYGLNTWVKQLARALDVDALIQLLERNAVINDESKTYILQEYNNEEKMHKLVFLLMHTSEEKLLKFCACLRELDQTLADLVENNNKDGKETEELLRKEEIKNIGAILTDVLQYGQHMHVTCEDVHIYVDEKRKCNHYFDVIKTCIKQFFPNVFANEKDTRFEGISWKKHVTDFQVVGKSKTSDVTSLTDMTCEEFADYVGQRIAVLNLESSELMQKAILDECITPKLFAKMTTDEFTFVFEKYLRQGDRTYGVGLKDKISEIQKIINAQLQRGTVKKDGVLREIDKICGKLKYTQCTVNPSTGNLLVAIHEYIYPESEKQNSVSFFTKEVIRFAAACINGLKNGTIHYGIKKCGNGMGQIIGVSDKFDIQKLNGEIGRSIEQCFEENANAALKCVRPVQVVSVENHGVVLEVDVVPYSAFLGKGIFQILFPPKGPQDKKCFFYDIRPDCERMGIKSDRISSIEVDYQKVWKNRSHLETCNTTSEGHEASLQQRLSKAITYYHKCVAQEFSTILCCGSLSGCHDEANIRDSLQNMSNVFAASDCVLEFDSSTALRAAVEQNCKYFTIVSAEDVKNDSQKVESDTFINSKLWVYCNGNDDIGKQKVTLDNFTDRFLGVKNVLQKARQRISKGRALLIFFVFEKPIGKDPMLEIAHFEFLYQFKYECLVISDSEEVVAEWKKDLNCNKEFEEYFHNGLSWHSVSQIFKALYPSNPDVVCKFPGNNGYSVDTLTSFEKKQLQLKDIKIVSGDLCQQEDKEFSKEDREKKKETQETQFYKGNEVSWWNFYYNHVGERYLCSIHKQEIRDMLQQKYKNSKSNVEVYIINHHPGAGGTTLGRHIIWHFSQFQSIPYKHSYRCCIVRNITESSTVQEIWQFMKFRDNVRIERPTIILIDNKPEEQWKVLQLELTDLANRHAAPDKIFCLLVIINRVNISEVESPRLPILQHDLTLEEKDWFEAKYKQLKDSEGVNVDTLLAFNLMRKAFSATYIKETTERLMQSLTPNEFDVLKCLATINAYDCDHPIPESIFDRLMSDTLSPASNKNDLMQWIDKPFGLVKLERERRAGQKFKRDIWNVSMSTALSLLIKRMENVSGSSGNYVGVLILSKILAAAIIDHIMTIKDMTLENLVDQLLDIVEINKSETNTMSKEFVKNVCILFKYRHVLESDKGEEKKKMKFSDMILDLQKITNQEDDANTRCQVVRLMDRCFNITKDPMVGQQLARYNIHIADYKAADIAIQKALEIQPRNCYLLDTFGQIYKAKMERACETKSQNEIKINDDDAVLIISSGLIAIELFRKAQEATNESGDDFNSHRMEVETFLNLLEMFKQFECYTDHSDFVQFLREMDSKDIPSSFSNVLRKTKDITKLQYGSNSQRHLENTLRKLEDRDSKIRYHFYTVYTTSNSISLLTWRDRYEQFYGDIDSKYEYRQGLDIKSLMNAYKGRKTKLMLQRRAEEAKEDIQRKGLKNLTKKDTRNLLIYIGYKIVLATQEGDDNISTTEYNELLSYSNVLVGLQNNKKSMVWLEAYLYHALLHWPRLCRINSFHVSLPDTYEQLLLKWENAYDDNFEIKSDHRRRRFQSKTFFALGKGTPGNDIVDLDHIRQKWRDEKKAEGRVMREVQQDRFYEHHLAEDRLERLDGFVDKTGHIVNCSVKYPHRNQDYPFKIKSYKGCEELSNRRVSFVLIFSFQGLRAYDIREYDKSPTPHVHNNENGHRSKNADERVQPTAKAPLDEPALKTEHITKPFKKRPSKKTTQYMKKCSREDVNAGLMSSQTHASTGITEKSQENLQVRRQDTVPTEVQVFGSRQTNSVESQQLHSMTPLIDSKQNPESKETIKQPSENTNSPIKRSKAKNKNTISNVNKTSKSHAGDGEFDEIQTGAEGISAPPSDIPATKAIDKQTMIFTPDEEFKPHKVNTDEQKPKYLELKNCPKKPKDKKAPFSKQPSKTSKQDRKPSTININEGACVDKTALETSEQVDRLATSMSDSQDTDVRTTDTFPTAVSKEKQVITKEKELGSRNKNSDEQIQFPSKSSENTKSLMKVSKGKTKKTVSNVNKSSDSQARAEVLDKIQTRAQRISAPPSDISAATRTSKKSDKRRGRARTQHGSLQANRTYDETHEDQSNQDFFTSNVFIRILSLIAVLWLAYSLVFR